MIPRIFYDIRTCRFWNNEAIVDPIFTKHKQKRSVVFVSVNVIDIRKVIRVIISTK